ncbi:MAG: FAD-dependent oxidoreductase [Gammaproteobacteria bacterium]|nr:FAD-dependent oxidoreductase [Gammaproteobacteria bacterium]
MKRNLSALRQKKFDLIVVGGGIYGSCAALDAAQRGLSVAIIERGDFCSATSANSFKIIHGGIRYMQHGDISHVRQSAQARSFLLRTAPHLTRPFPVVVPTYGYGMKSKGIMRIAMALYDMITCDRNRDIKDPARHVPPGYCLSREEVMQRYPDVDQDGLSGAAVFHDGQMYNPPRLVLAFVRAAAELGAEAANYVEATGFIREGRRITGVIARDVLTVRDPLRNGSQCCGALR